MILEQFKETGFEGQQVIINKVNKYEVMYKYGKNENTPLNFGQYYKQEYHTATYNTYEEAKEEFNLLKDICYIIKIRSVIEYEQDLGQYDFLANLKAMLRDKKQ